MQYVKYLYPWTVACATNKSAFSGRVIWITASADKVFSGTCSEACPESGTLTPLLHLAIKLDRFCCKIKFRCNWFWVYTFLWIYSNSPKFILYSRKVNSFAILNVSKIVLTYILCSSGWPIFWVFPAGLWRHWGHPQIVQHSRPSSCSC